MNSDNLSESLSGSSGSWYSVSSTSYSYCSGSSSEEEFTDDEEASINRYVKISDDGSELYNEYKIYNYLHKKSPDAWKYILNIDSYVQEKYFNYLVFVKEDAVSFSSFIKQ